jgi:hypothetical protein
MYMSVAGERLAGGEQVGMVVICTEQCLGVMAQMVVQLSYVDGGTTANTLPVTQHHIPDVCVSSAHKNDCCKMEYKFL